MAAAAAVGAPSQKWWGKVGAGEMALRCSVTVLSVAAAVMVVRDRAQQLPYSDSSGLTFLVYTNALVAIYNFVVAFLSCSFKLDSAIRSSNAGAWVLFALDQVLAYILLSATSAVTEITYLLQNGDLKLLWDPRCESFGHFCHIVEVSIIISFIVVLMLGVASILSAKKLFQRYVVRIIVAKNKMGVL